jgi:1-deoxy-D-xylulose-5-phosphate synthase
VKPLDEALIAELAASHELLVTIEENCIAGGAGSAVNEALAAQGYEGMALNLGLPDRYVEHGAPEEMLAECGLDKAGIINAIENRLKQRQQNGQKSTA